jgi:hypothetical protein
MFGLPDGPPPESDPLDAGAASQGLAASPGNPGTNPNPNPNPNEPGNESHDPHGAGSAAAAWPGVREVAQLLARLAVNCHTLCDEELRPLGTGLYLSAALVNHGCVPSAVQAFEGGVLLLRCAAGPGAAGGTVRGGKAMLPSARGSPAGLPGGRKKDLRPLLGVC